jgi:hypothetical protein
MLALVAAVALLVVLGSSSLSPVMAADRDAIPPDFALRAQYYPALPSAPGFDIPGGRRWHPWTMTLTADGRAHQESDRTVPGKRRIIRKSVRVAPRNVEGLVAEVRRANFFVLVPEYAFAVTPHPILVLRVTMEGRSHEVTVYAPDRVKGEPEVTAFLRVWNQTLRLVPSLNPGQRPE